MKILVPCCGRSSRYPNQPPKWLLPAYDGRPMLSWALSQVAHRPSDVVVTVLREHEDRFQVTAGLTQLFGEGIQVVALDRPTTCQAETIVRTLERLEYTGPFLIKDSDNSFALDDIARPYNYVCVQSLNNFDEINPRNKCYVSADHTGLINNIREKTVIADTFGVGGYYFTEATTFLRAWSELNALARGGGRELYISDLIGWLIGHGVDFYTQQVAQYHDWGTIHEWRKFLQSHGALLVALDGFVFERGHRHFEPLFQQVRPNAEAIDALVQAAARGSQIIYLSVRPPELRDLTEHQMAEAGVPAGQVLFGCPNSPWQLVAAPHPVMPFRTVSTVEVSPGDASVSEKLSAV